uniref:Uncharacterized protein n=1 Tax=Pan paniscus TaxID=9597 RepID=A0A2R8Z5R7_PANPA
MVDSRGKVLQDYRKKLLEHKIDGRLNELREQLKELTKQYEKSENDLKALQSVGQIVGEVLQQLTEAKFIVKATNGPRCVVGCRRQLDKRQTGEAWVFSHNNASYQKQLNQIYNICFHSLKYPPFVP